jgi:hypothetical protein
LHEVDAIVEDDSPPFLSSRLVCGHGLDLNTLDDGVFDNLPFGDATKDAGAENSRCIGHVYVFADGRRNLMMCCRNKFDEVLRCLSGAVGRQSRNLTTRLKTRK